MKLLVLVLFNSLTRVLIRYIKTVYSLLYSYYISMEFKSISDGYIFESPVILKGAKYITIGKGFSPRARLRIEAWDSYNGNIHKPTIIIGDNVVLNFDCHIGAINFIQIGNDVLIGSNVLITDHNHGKITTEELKLPPASRPLYSKGPVIIEDNVWIGENVAILPNVRIGRNSIIGANSVVSSDVPENSVVGGIPAKVIKQL